MLKKKKKEEEEFVTNFNYVNHNLFYYENNYLS